MRPDVILKRDKETVPFDPKRITEALRLAVVAGGGAGIERAGELTEAVISDIESRLADAGGKHPADVEMIEESIEYTLFKKGLPEAAYAYVRHRFKKERVREERDELGRIVGEILAEKRRENANLGSSPAAKMLQIAATASRIYYTEHLIPREFVLAHQWGRIHIHDLDYYGKTANCLQIDLARLLEKGFNPGYGFVRPPRRIGSAAALAAVIIQCNQNDMYGGQSYPHFDRDMGGVIRRQRPSPTAAETAQAMESFLFSINTMHSRAGGNVPFSSVNIGGDTTPEGRLVTRALLEAYERGLGRGETPLFPNIVFRLKKGVNFEPGDPNHDLFQLAMRVAARRMNPTFSFMDASFNRPYGDEVAYMGCRTRVMGNRRGSEVAAGRGNIAPVTMNLPGLALRARTPGRFMTELDGLVALAARQVLHRYRILCSLKARELPFLMGQGLYLDSGSLGPDDAIEPALRHGTLAVGFIGLAEALTVLTGRHHGESDESLRLGLEIVGRIRERTDGLSLEHDLNITCYATPAEGLSGRFTLLDRETFGRVRGVTDSDFYTNSFHVPVACPLGAFEKMEREAPFHRLCNAGHISYVELPSAPEHNIAAVEKLLKRLAELDAGYAGINFPIDECRACGRRGLSDGACSSCGSTDIRRIRRVTGYLSTEDRFNPGKRAELKARIAHRL